MKEVPAKLSPRVPAVGAFLLFVPVAVSFAISPGAWWVNYPGILFHLALFLLVPLLPAPSWAKAAGYGWLLLDVTAGVLVLRGLPREFADAVRLSGHLFGGMWIVSASLPGSWPVRISGVLCGVYLFAFTFASPFLPLKAMGPASVAMLLWLVIVAWQDGIRSRSAR